MLVNRHQVIPPNNQMILVKNQVSWFRIKIITVVLVESWFDSRWAFNVLSCPLMSSRNNVLIQKITWGSGGVLKCSLSAEFPGSTSLPILRFCISLPIPPSSMRRRFRFRLKYSNNIQINVYLNMKIYCIYVETLRW